MRYQRAFARQLDLGAPPTSTNTRAHALEPPSGCAQRTASELRLGARNSNARRGNPRARDSSAVRDLAGAKVACASGQRCAPSLSLLRGSRAPTIRRAGGLLCYSGRRRLEGPAGQLAAPTRLEGHCARNHVGLIIVVVVVVAAAATAAAAAAAGAAVAEGRVRFVVAIHCC